MSQFNNDFTAAFQAFQRYLGQTVEVVVDDESIEFTAVLQLTTSDTTYTNDYNQTDHADMIFNSEDWSDYQVGSAVTIDGDTWAVAGLRQSIGDVTVLDLERTQRKTIGTVRRND